MTIFENTNERPAILGKVFCAIKTLPPTSFEAERAFSAVGLIVTKLRSSLKEETIDALTFLRKNLKKERFLTRDPLKQIMLLHFFI